MCAPALKKTHEKFGFVFLINLNESHELINLKIMLFSIFHKLNLLKFLKIIYIFLFLQI